MTKPMTDERLERMRRTAEVASRVTTCVRFYGEDKDSLAADLRWAADEIEQLRLQHRLYEEYVPCESCGGYHLPSDIDPDCMTCKWCLKLADAVGEIDRLHKGWTPTTANVNELPDPIRRYIHDLETRCDPADDVAKLTLTMQQNEMLQKEIERLRAIVDKLPKTADGVPITSPGQVVYHDMSDHPLWRDAGYGVVACDLRHNGDYWLAVATGVLAGSRPGHFSELWMSPADCYSTREAAEQAKEADDD